MKIALMRGDTVPASELTELGFHAMQMFFGHGIAGEGEDPTPDAIDTKLAEGGVALAAMTLHIDLVNAQGVVADEVARCVRCVEKTAALDGRFGDNTKPILVWHPSAYPGWGTADVVDDRAIFVGLCDALRDVTAAAESCGVDVAVEITRAGSIGSAETYLRVKDHVPSPSLKVCLDAANFVPDRTPLERAVRMLGPDVVIAHGKDSSFADTGEVAQYGPVGSGKLDYAAYMRALAAYTDPAYFVLEYYGTREELLAARDIVSNAMNG